jgi:hypothetical protein
MNYQTYLAQCTQTEETPLPPKEWGARQQNFLDEGGY